MSITAVTGPYIAFGQAQFSDYNGDAGPSLFFNGQGILDPRPTFTYQPGQNSDQRTMGWLGTTAVPTLNVIPYTKATQAIAANANAVANTPLVLVSTASTTTGVSIVSTIVNETTGVADTNGGAGFVGLDTYASCTATVAGNVLTVTAVTNANLTIGMAVLTIAGTLTGVTPVGARILAFGTGVGGLGTYILTVTAGTVTTGTVTLQIPGPRQSTVPYGQNGNVRIWNDQAIIGRVVAITAATAASGTVVFTVKGYDIYGFPMIETITAAANTQTLGKKAFKYIKSVTPGTSDAQNYSVDTTDVIGFPLRSDNFGDVLINYSASLNPAVITANSGYTASVQTTPSATTGDVRGTYTLQTASSTNANRLVIHQSPSPYNIGTTAGLVGASQFSTGF